MNLGELSYINKKKIHDAIVRLLEQFALITMNILHVFLCRQMFQRYIFARFFQNTTLELTIAVQ